MSKTETYRVILTERLELNIKAKNEDQVWKWAQTHTIKNALPVLKGDNNSLRYSEAVYPDSSGKFDIDLTEGGNAA